MNLKEKIFSWKEEKNKFLQKERGISFEEIVEAIKNNKTINILEHHKVEYQHQELILVEINKYVYVVPCIKKDKEVFLITIFPDRKMTKKYLGR